MTDLLEILDQTPNVEHLSITFAQSFHDHYVVDDDRFQTMMTNFRCLKNLQRLSFRTKQAKRSESNECLPLNQLQLFIDHCSLHRTILKKVMLKFDYIRFHQDFWSTVIRYKNTFEHFNVYISFLVEGNVSESIERLSIPDQFDFHIEDGDPIHPQARFLHVYSLPFRFHKLHGFICCSKLSNDCSYSSVHHLNFTQTRLGRPISFDLLSDRMPNLISIDCDLTFSLGYHNTFPQIHTNENLFNSIRSFRFILHCWNKLCICRQFLPRLLDRMPHLKSLTTSEINFINAQHPLPPIKRLDLRQCHFQLTESLSEHLPYLLTLSLGYILTNEEELFQFLNDLFLGIVSLKMVSFRLGSECGNDRTHDEQIAKQVLTRTKNINNRLRYLKLDFVNDRADFSLRNF